MMHKIFFTLTFQITLALFLGCCLGLILQNYPIAYSDEILSITDMGGYGFIQALKYIATPLVFTSIIGGIMSLGSFKLLGRIGFKTISLYLITTLIAVISSLTFMSIVNPKFQLNLEKLPQEENLKFSTFWEALYEALTKNPLDSLDQGNLLQLILIALIAGCILMLFFGKNKSAVRGFNVFHEWMMRLVIFFMKFAPLGIFCLMTNVFYSLGIDAIIPLGSYLSLIILMIFYQAFIIYPLFLKFLGGISPIYFYKKIKNVILLASSTASSNATLPVTLETVEKELLVDSSISSFSIPLGATINMDALALAYGVAAVFLSNAYGIDLSFDQYLNITFWTVIASVGTAGIPGVGLIALFLVFQQAHLPTHGIPMLMSVSRFGDMIGTALNVTGDIVVTCIVAKSEGKMGEKNEVYVNK